MYIYLYTLYSLKLLLPSLNSQEISAQPIAYVGERDQALCEAELTNLLLKSHNFLANVSSLAGALGVSSLQSTKYFPVTPLRVGCRAT